MNELLYRLSKEEYFELLVSYYGIKYKNAKELIDILYGEE